MSVVIPEIVVPLLLRFPLLGISESVAIKFGFKLWELASLEVAVFQAARLVLDPEL